jgi:hypothetical protein
MDRAQQLTGLGGIGDAGKVTRLLGLERAAQVRGWIALGAAGRNGVAEYLPADLLQALRGFKLVQRFEPAQHRQQFRAVISPIGRLPMHGNTYVSGIHPIFARVVSASLPRPASHSRATGSNAVTDAR